ncbi:MAG: hypothetical protein LBD84_07340 [Campylobacteraceae bacterium]|jgi:hypothetical protein|nr:hypothetical protein [Campylobacteraceae bacterium]
MLIKINLFGHREGAVKSLQFAASSTALIGVIFCEANFKNNSGQIETKNSKNEKDKND